MDPNSGKPEKLRTATEYLFGNQTGEERDYFVEYVEPYFSKHGTGGHYEEFYLNGEKINILIINLNLTLSFDQTAFRQDHVLTLGVLLPPTELNLPIPTIFIVGAGICLICFIIVGLVVWFCIFQTTHRMIRPLRHLNDRMTEIMEEENTDADINIQESC